jgi:hypothetical protein
VNLADLFSAIDSAKRNLGDNVKNPRGGLTQLMGSIQDAWRGIKEKPVPTDLKASDKELETALSAVLNFAPGGMLRLGGRADLMPVHTTSPGGFERMLRNSGRDRQGVAELYSPSIGVQKGGLQPLFGDMYLIPKVGAFDPKTYPSTMWNRDAYTPRRTDFPGNPVSSLADADFSRGSYRYRTMAEDRLLDRFMTDPEGYRMTEGLGVGNKGKFGASVHVTPDHADAMMASPHFRSYSQYERSPYGADVLMDKGTTGGLGSNSAATAENLYTDFRGDFRDAQDKWGRRLGDDAGIMHEIDLHGLIQTVKKYEDLLKDSPEGAKLFGEYRSRMASLPSDYAEVKMTGAVPITREHWAGVMLPDQGKEAQKVVRAYLDRQGIQTFDYRPNDVFANSNDQAAHARELFDIADMLQKVAGPTRRQPIFPGADFKAPSKMPRRAELPPEVPKRIAPATEFSGGGWPSSEMFETWKKNGFKLFVESQGKKYPIEDFYSQFYWDLKDLKVEY